MGLFTKNYPEEIAARVPPGQRLVKTWPVLHYGPIPRFDGTEWDLTLSGLVEEPVTLSYQERRIYHQHEELDRRIGPDNVPAELRVQPMLADWVEG